MLGRVKLISRNQFPFPRLEFVGALRGSLHGPLQVQLSCGEVVLLDLLQGQVVIRIGIIRIQITGSL